MSAPTPTTHDGQANPWELFGLDLRTIGQDWLHAMRQWHQMAPLRWFELKPLVQVLRPDRSVALWQDGRLHPQGHASAHAPLTVRAVQLPEALLLRRTLQLPDLPDTQVRDAVALDIFSSSPFAQDDTAWGYVNTRSNDGLHTAAAFASRAQIAQYLHQVREHLPAGWQSEQCEIWALPATGDATDPIVLQGYGEALAEQARGRRRMRAWLALGTGLALLGALALTPTLQLRSQALQADAAYNQLVAQTDQLAQERTVLASALERITQIKQRQALRENLAQVLQFLSALLPADVSLHTLEFAQEKPEPPAAGEDFPAEPPAPRLILKLMGEADNAAAMIQLLSAQASFAEVRTTQPVQQIPNANKERFTVEIVIAPGAFNLLYTPEDLPEPPSGPREQAPEAPAPEPPAASAPESGTRPAPEPAHPVPPSAAAPAPAPGAPASNAGPSSPSRIPPNAGVTPMTAPQVAPATLAGQRTAPPPAASAASTPEAMPGAADAPAEPDAADAHTDTAEGTP